MIDIKEINRLRELHEDFIRYEGAIHGGTGTGLQNCYSYEDGHHEFLEWIVSNFVDLLDYVEKLEKDKWISTSERLPKYTGDYNVTVGVGSMLGYFEEVRTYRYEIYNGKNSYQKWIIPNKIDEIVNVIAWMSLPEPYKGSD